MRSNTGSIPWTPAPWKWRHEGADLRQVPGPDGKPYGAPVLLGIDYECATIDDADARLIELAPEMAEAILAKYAPCGTDDPEHGTSQCSDHTANWPQACDYHENAPSLYDVAQRLRAIGADHAG